MVKKLLLFLIFLLLFWSKAQLDSEHWFAPIFDRTGGDGTEQFLTLSTNETTPFVVRIYNGGVMRMTATISKGNSQTIPIDGNLIITSKVQDLFTKGTKGLFLSGEKKYYATLKVKTFEVDLLKGSSEYITSKGNAALGTSFRALPVSIPAYSERMEFQTSIIATEDGTSVTVSNFNPNIIFGDGTRKNPNITFTLNKGESYIIEGNLTDRTSNFNKDGFIGAKIEANKPISVTSGNFLSTNAGNGGMGDGTPIGDIYIDQLIPVNKLGTKFVLTGGNGGYNGGYIVATEDNTKVTLYGTNATPDVIVLNAGEYAGLDLATFPIQRNGFRSLGIVSEKPIYVNQVMLGTGSRASGISALVPALDCFIPNNIDEITDVDLAGNTPMETARINIIAKKGAKVYVRGSLLGGSQGPYAVAGISDWEVYNLDGYRGTLVVNSDKSVIANVVAGDEGLVSGYGEYFTGFDTQPKIHKTGDCNTGVKLEVSGGFDTYKWYFNNVLLTGETSATISPEKYGIGIYYCVVGINGCDEKPTDPYNYNELCPTKTKRFIDMGICQTKEIVLQFSASSDPVDPSKTQITLAPSFGTLVQLPNGNLLYTPNSTNTNTYQDLFAYKIEGSGHYEEFLYAVNIYKVNVRDDIWFKCRDMLGNVTFDLTTRTLSDNNTDVYEFYESESDARNQINPISDPHNYSKVQKVYARVTSIYGCWDISTIELRSSVVLNKKIANTLEVTQCKDPLAPTKQVNLYTFNDQIAFNAGLFLFRYYLTRAEAEDGSGDGLNPEFSFSTSTSIFARVWYPSCPLYDVFEIKLTFKDETPINAVSPVLVCKSEFEKSGGYMLDLSSFNTSITSDGTAVFKYYLSTTDAYNDINSITPIRYVTSPTDFVVRVIVANHCPSYLAISIGEKPTKTSETLKDIKVCKNATGVLDAGPGFDSYKWSTGETTQSINAGVGSYWVDLTVDGCTTRQNVNVTPYDDPVISKIDIKGNIVTITAIGGKAPYQFAIDGADFSDSNVFSGITNGLHIVKLRDANNCTVVEMPFSIFAIINAFSPNGDGVNDVLDFSELKLKQNPKMTIFDRQGTKVFEGSSNNNFIWTGKEAGRPFPTGTYWYVLEWAEMGTSTYVQRSGWVLLKNR